MTGFDTVPLALNRVVLVTRDQIVTGASELFGLSVLAGTLAAVVAISYRWYTRECAPFGLAMLFGLAAVAVYLNTTTALGQVISGEMNPIDVALFNIVAFLFGAGGAATGHRVGDHFGEEVLLSDTRQDVDDEVSRLVETVGRVTSVELPEEIDDVAGYDPVTPQTKEKLAGKRFVFPRNLTVKQLHERLVSRLKTDYAIGTVDMELRDDGSVDYLAVGSRAAGIGPTLPPATNAVAIRADPAFAASTGDLVQVWEADSMRRVLTAELRGVAEDVVTIAISSADTPKIDPTRRYRLVTLPVDDRPEREFASLLRVADETFSSVTVEAGSPLHGMPVGALDLTIVSVKPESEEPTALPNPAYVLAPGDVVFAIALPEALRKLETAAEPLDPALVQDIGTPTPTPATPQDTQPTAGQASPQTSRETDARISGEAGRQPDTATRPDTDTGVQPEAHAEPDPIEGTPDTARATDAPDSDTAVADAGDQPGEESGGGKAGTSTFDELKEEYESGDGWEDDEETDDSEPVEAAASSSDSDAGDIDAGDSDSGGGTSFDELKSEFESGDADWAEDSTESGGTDEPALESDDSGEEGVEADADSGSDDGSDDLVSLEEADISFGDEEENEEGESEEPLEAESELDGLDIEDDEDEDLVGEDGLFEESDDDLDALDLEDDGGDDDLDALEFDDDEEGESEEEEETEDDEDDDDDDDDDGGGGTSFAQLKEEFESGDADWEDDISDSPGGDMRLDE